MGHKHFSTYLLSLHLFNPFKPKFELTLKNHQGYKKVCFSLNCITRFLLLRTSAEVGSICAKIHHHHCFHLSCVWHGPYIYCLYWLYYLIHIGCITYMYDLGKTASRQNSNVIYVNKQGKTLETCHGFSISFTFDFASKTLPYL